MTRRNGRVYNSGVSLMPEVKREWPADLEERVERLRQDRKTREPRTTQPPSQPAAPKRPHSAITVDMASERGCVICLMCLSTDCWHVPRNCGRYGLGPRVVQVLQMIGAGADTQEIIATLGIQRAQVQNCVGQLFSRLEACNRVQLALWAREHEALIHSALKRQEAA